MPLGQAGARAAKQALPFLAKQLPRLWPLLLESKNREKVRGLVRDMASSSPKTKLRARLEATELLAETVADQAASPEERERATQWQHRANRMRVRLEMPVAGVKARQQHRRTLRHDLERLHEEMSEALRSDEPG